MRALGEQAPAWQHGDWLDLLVGLRRVCDRVEGVLASLPEDTDAPAPSPDEAVDALVGAVVLARRLARLLDAAAEEPTDAAESVERPGDSPPDGLLR